MHLRLIQVNKQIEQPGQQQLIVGVALAASAQALLVSVVVAEQPLDQLVHGDHWLDGVVVREAAGGAAIAAVAGLGEVGEELLVVEAVLLDLVAELVALRRQLVDEFDHGRTLALVHGVEEAGARHLLELY